MARKARQIQTDKPRERILFFDLLRIACVALIVYGHSQYDYLSWLNGVLFMEGYTPMNIYPLGLTGLSVFGLIFVSGAVLEYNYQTIRNFLDYKRFVFKRVVRIYPAFWLSLLLSIILFPWVLQNGLFSTIMEFTGFFVILGQGPGYLNTMGWFIGTIIFLYLLFPFLSKFIREYRHWALIAFLLISFISRSILRTFPLDSSGLLPMWLPICNIFEFCLGIYLIQNAIYPKTVNNSPIIRGLSDLSYYVFLFHMVIIDAFYLDLLNNGPIMVFVVNAGMHITEISYTFFYLGMMGCVLIISILAQLMDKKIQKCISNNEKVRIFLKE